MFNPEFLEFLNVYLMLMDVAIIAVLVTYLIRRGKRDKGWYDPGAQLAVAIVLYLIGHCLERFWRMAENLNWPHIVIEAVVPAGLIMAVIGLIWIARRLYEPIGIKVWFLIAAGLAILAASIVWGASVLLSVALLALLLAVMVGVRFLEAPK